MKKVFITGISGLLGSNLSRQLLGDNYHVKAIIRNPATYSGPQSPHLELITMDLWGDYGPHLGDVQTVVHMAAETATNLLDCHEYDLVNTQATIRLYEISKKQGVRQFIFVSTANTIGFGSLTSLGAETQSIKKPFSKLCYAQSKWKAEEYLLRHRHEVDIRILNPTFMIGPYDTKPSSGKIIRTALGKKVVFYPPGGKNFVPVKDVAKAIVQSFKFGSSGEKYLIAGENLTYGAFFRRLRKVSRDRQWLIPIPHVLLLLMGIFGDLIRSLNIRSSLSSVHMRILCTKNFYANQKSLDDLSMTYTSLDGALKEAIDYFKG